MCVNVDENFYFLKMRNSELVIECEQEVKYLIKYPNYLYPMVRESLISVNSLGKVL